MAAFVDDGPERTYYYDRDTERMVSVWENHRSAGDDEVVWQLESDIRGRFVPVPKPRFEDVLNEQDEFVESLTPGALRTRLEQLLENDPDGSKLARLVTQDRLIRPLWRQFRSERARERAREFIARLR